MKKQTIIFLIGFALLAIVVYMWVLDYNEVKIGRYYNGLVYNGWIGKTLEEVATERVGINMKYGLWSALIVISTAGLMFINHINQKNKSTLSKTNEPENIDAEIEALKTVAELERKKLIT